MEGGAIKHPTRPARPNVAANDCHIHVCRRKRGPSRSRLPYAPTENIVSFPLIHFCAIKQVLMGASRGHYSSLGIPTSSGLNTVI